MSRPEKNVDPWQTAIDRHFAPGEGVSQSPGPAKPGTRTLNVWWTVAALGLLVVVLAGAGYLGFAARENHDTADKWRDRSVELEALVADRTRALNRQTARLNVASNKLRSARRSLRRSERDVAQFEVRQRELAAEKASVEDARAALAQEREDLITQRSALADIANQLGSCNSGLLDLIQLLSDGYAPGTIDIDPVANSCQGARSAVDSYVAFYGTP